MFKPYYGTCSYPGCTRTNAPIVVKSGWCDRCNHKHKEIKKKEAGKSIKKCTYVKPKTGESEIFLQVWENSNQRCFVCDKAIPYPIASNFLHVLSKALNKFPKFKLYPKNIVLGCHDSETSCHHRWDKMPRSSLIEPMWKPLFELEAELKEEYKQLKSSLK